MLHDPERFPALFALEMMMVLPFPPITAKIIIIVILLLGASLPSFAPLGGVEEAMVGVNKTAFDISSFHEGDGGGGVGNLRTR